MDMGSGLRIATVRGIPIRIHFTFLLVLPFLVYAFGRELDAAARRAGIPGGELGGSPWLWGLGLAVALFGSVLVHELAHSLYALRKGGRVRGITLLPIGGVSELTEAPTDPVQEAIMALLGPATSLVLGVVSYWAYRWTLAQRSLELSFAFYYLGYVNLSLGIFNLLPAFPMDGGRILRGLLARKKGPVRSTQIAATVGKLFAALFAVVGFLSANIILMLVGFFVFIAAEGEQRQVLARAVLGDLRVREVMAQQAGAVSPAETLYQVGERMLHERRLAFPVTDDGHVLGVVTAEGIERVPLPRRRAEHVAEAMEEAPVIDSDDRVVDALRLLAEKRVSQLPVMHQGRVVGTLSQLEIARGLRLRELEASQRQAAS